MAAPAGHPKWGGRALGTPNKVNLEVRNRIESEADPVGFLIKVIKGHKIKGECPTLTQRMRAAEKLLSRVMPELKAVEMSVEAEVVPAIDQQAREKVLKLIDNKIQHGAYEALKTMGLSDAEAYKAMRKEASERALPNAS